ncbi:MAG: J domain-containing protein [Pseudobdellovibrionaceae bacterium]
MKIIIFIALLITFKVNAGEFDVVEARRILSSKNLYEVLNVHPNSSNDEIKRAYRLLARKYHPDLQGRNPNPKAEALSTALLKQLNDAKETLLDPAKRLKHDNKLNIFKQRPSSTTYSSAASSKSSNASNSSNTSNKSNKTNESNTSKKTKSSNTYNTANNKNQKNEARQSSWQNTQGRSSRTFNEKRQSGVDWKNATSWAPPNFDSKQEQTVNEESKSSPQPSTENKTSGTKSHNSEGVTENSQRINERFQSSPENMNEKSPDSPSTKSASASSSSQSSSAKIFPQKQNPKYAEQSAQKYNATSCNGSFYKHLIDVFE